ncbi:predicted protein [Uncinocarpus reesii 1704]|uniref:Nuclear pore complex protein Nup85 n=1 Tax=Uncinocarpus reesii (strain UAMH 1704) TaxID=336963 RepID=C4JKI2_UNCRE|nr:uncharacterized protein UREG_02139 [Uncinocarpus reesii 1704]EEP77290.1 predicted protein [Uncinocarpus reesii 1704]
MAFRRAYGDSSPPSTPAKPPDFGSSAFSLTPAGHPPSSAGSFTPAGNPPSSYYFGSSVDSQASEDLLSFSTNSTNFSASQSRNAPFPSFRSRQTREPSTNLLRGVGGGRSIPRSKLSQSFTFSNDGEEEDNLEEMDTESPRRMDLEEDDAPLPSTFPRIGGGPAAHMRKSMIYSNPKSAKRAKLDENWAQSFPPSPPQIRWKKQPSSFPRIAVDIASRENLAALDEPSGLLLSMEDTISEMYDQVRDREADDDTVDIALSSACEDLPNLWKQYSEEPGSVNYENGCIGPGEQSSGIMKAGFLSSLLLRLHHPPILRRHPADRRSQSSRSPFHTLAVSQPSESKSSIPKVLFDWLNQHHSPQSAQFNALKRQQPNPTASHTFWSIVLAALLRADFSFVIQLLEAADFSYARTAMEEGSKEPGYRGRQLQIIQQCVNKALQLLRTSPGVKNDDWDIKGMDWAMYRKQVMSAVSELEDLAEGPDRDSAGGNWDFQASHFGLSSIRSGVSSFSQSARMAESKIPWMIYQYIKDLYGIILGAVPTILKYSEDWVEATVGLAAWWNGDDDSEITLDNRHSNQLAVKRSQGPRSVDINTEEAYLRRLDYAFTCVTDTLGKDGLQINSMNPSEVGLACVFEGNVEGVLRLMQTWSLSIAAATAEVASFGGWLDSSVGSEPMPGLNENDLMVLNYGQPDQRLRKDDVLVNFSSGLFDRGRLDGPSSVREGWELSLEVLSRLDDQGLMKTKVNEFLDRVTIDSSEKMDRLVLLCTELGYNEEGRKISERYGDKIAQNSEEYGAALFCYARAHCIQKIKNVVDLLISLCLVQSTAYPPKSELDTQLRSLLYEPTAALSAIASVDNEGAAMLQFHFSGYATLRNYYDIRDEEVNLEPGQKPKHRPLARKRAAAQALTAVISSAADSIYGGLYDQDRKTAVQPDGLLVLLGESLALIEHPNQYFIVDQLQTILAAIEDLQTVTSRVYDQCEECLQSAVLHHRNYRGTGTAQTSSPDDSRSHSPTNLLRKSVSSMSGSFSGFSLIGSEILEPQNRSRGTIDSGVLVPRLAGGDANVKRGWDWREMVRSDVKGEEILKALRLRLARGLCFGELRDWI